MARPRLRGWSSRNDAEAEAYLLADNRLTESGGWDDRELVAMLEDIQAADATLFEALTWSTEELDDLFRLYREDADPDLTVEHSTGPDESDDDTDDEDEGRGERLGSHLPADRVPVLRPRMVPVTVDAETLRP
jgi:hypothetical protein